MVINSNKDVPIICIIKTVPYLILSINYPSLNQNRFIRCKISFSNFFIFGLMGRFG